MGDTHVAALTAAYAVAMSARTNTLSQHAVEDMRIKAEELLRDHPAYPVITAFATQYELHHRNREMLASLGETLEMGVRLSVAPAAPDNQHWSDRDA